MGASNSKPEATSPFDNININNNNKNKTKPLQMCKLRNKLIKQAMDSRYSLAAAHLSYTHSLRNIGLALRRFAQAQLLINDSSLSPSHSSYHPSPSPSHLDSPIRHRLSYMRSAGAPATSAVTLTYNPSTKLHSFLPPPPPLPPDDASAWDYFHATTTTTTTTTTEQVESFRFVGLDSMDASSSDSIRLWGDVADRVASIAVTPTQESRNGVVLPGNDDSNVDVVVKDLEESELKCGSKNETTEREDPSEFITHRAKDFVSSIKDIEHRFFKASESGKEVGRMLEANKIRVGYAEPKRTSSSSDLFTACPLVCCRGRSLRSSHEHVRKIVWKRSVSSQSSFLRNPLASAFNADDSGSECVEDFCMISGSHSSTLDRLYAWERKLYDEVKASEVIRKEYDKKCNQLRHQFAKDLSVHVIDKTRAAIKDLHSRLRVALHAVDSIAKRIEKMRDDELQPQLNELIQGFIRMWKAMLECHHAQYITISLAYHAKSTVGSPGGEARKQIMAQLQYEVECFGVSFADWMNSHTSYVEALNGWLQNCVLPPQERSRNNKRPFSPRRSLAPPIFVLFRDWSAGIKLLPSTEVSDAIRNFSSDLQHLMKQQQAEDKRDKMCSNSNGELQDKDEETYDHKSGNFSCIHTSMTRVLDKLTKFSEASVKLYEDIRQKSEAARVAYSNPRSYRC